MKQRPNITNRREFLQTTAFLSVAPSLWNRSRGAKSAALADSSEANQESNEPNADRLEWHFKGVESVLPGEYYGNTRSSPTVVDERVYVQVDEEHTFALDASTGDEIWRFSPMTKSIVRVSQHWMSPTVVEDTVYVAFQADDEMVEPEEGSIGNLRDAGSVYALNTDDGTAKWRFETETYVQHSPTVANGTVFIGDTDGTVYAIDKSEAIEQWQTNIGSNIWASPTVVDGTVYIGSYGTEDEPREGYVYALDSQTGTVKWRYDANATIWYGATVVEGVVFIGEQALVDDNDNFVEAGNLFALDAETGDQIWSFQTKGIVTVPTVADGVVYIGSTDSNVYALNAADGTKKWECETSGEVYSSPTIVGDTVFIGSDDGNVYAIDANDGTKQWSYFIGGEVQSSPTVVDGTLFVGTYNFDGEAGVFAIDAGVEGSSEGSRVQLGTTGHHHAWATRDLNLGTPPTPSILVNANEPTVGDSVVLDGSGSRDALSQIASYEWDINGDGAFELNGETVEHTFVDVGTTEVRLRVTDARGNTASTSTTVDVQPIPQPEAAFSTEPFDPTTETSVIFNADASVQPDGTIAEYEWDIDGDGTFERTGLVIEHTFDSTGFHEVTLRVTGSPGKTDTNTETVQIAPAPPKAEFTTDPASPTTETSVTFDASPSNSPDRELLAYEWDLDNDGTFERTGQSIDHTFENTGTYEVVLRVTDSADQTAVQTQPVIIESSSGPGTTEPPQSGTPTGTGSGGGGTDTKSGTQTTDTATGSESENRNLNATNNGQEETTTPGMPGFGLPSALVGLGSATYVMKRRLSGDEDWEDNQRDD